MLEVNIMSYIPGEFDLGSPFAAGLLSTGGGETYLPRGDAARLTASSRARFSSSSFLFSSSRLRSSSRLLRSFFSCNAYKLNYGTFSLVGVCSGNRLPSTQKIKVLSVAHMLATV